MPGTYMKLLTSIRTRIKGVEGEVARKKLNDLLDVIPQFIANKASAKKISHGRRFALTFKTSRVLLTKL